MTKNIGRGLLCMLATSTLLFLVRCKGSESVKCSWGEVCPEGLVCHEPTEGCVLPDQISSCIDKNDYEPCEYPGSSPHNVCRNGICIIPACGDSILDPGEDCDGTDLGGATCESLGLGEGTLRCNTNCTFDTSGCELVPVCGNNVREGNEVCDGHDLGGETCDSLGYYEGGVLGCSDDCMDFDTSGCQGGVCGDGVINGPEVCDGHDLGGETCDSLGLLYGELGCLDDCSGFDTSGCMQWMSISSGRSHTCGIKTNGTVWCWGFNSNGQLGNGQSGSNLRSRFPVQVLNLTDVSTISSGHYHTCATKTDGTTWCWGQNYYGQLGDGSLTNSSTPVQVLGLTDVSAISGGHRHTCAIKTDKTAWCWGCNEYGQLGNGTNDDTNTPVQVLNIVDISAISNGRSHTCAIKTDKTAWCWGRNQCGTLGDGTNNNSNTPVQVVNLADVSSISSGYLLHTCATKTDGTAWCWGCNIWGNLGDGTDSGSYTPVQVLNLTNASAISSGFGHTCATKTDGTTSCWGYNGTGNLGDGTTDDSLIPVQVEQLTDVSVISSGSDHTCAIEGNGTAWCWGRNEFYQLGDGTTDDSNTPVEVE